MVAVVFFKLKKNCLFFYSKFKCSSSKYRRFSVSKINRYDEGRINRDVVKKGLSLESKYKSNKNGNYSLYIGAQSWRDFKFVSFNLNFIWFPFYLWLCLCFGVSYYFMGLFSLVLVFLPFFVYVFLMYFWCSLLCFTLMTAFLNVFVLILPLGTGISLLCVKFFIVFGWFWIVSRILIGLFKGLIRSSYAFFQYSLVWGFAVLKEFWKTLKSFRWPWQVNPGLWFKFAQKFFWRVRLYLFWLASRLVLWKRTVYDRMTFGVFFEIWSVVGPHINFLVFNFLLLPMFWGLNYIYSGFKWNLNFWEQAHIFCAKYRSFYIQRRFNAEYKRLIKKFNANTKYEDVILNPKFKYALHKLQIKYYKKYRKVAKRFLKSSCINDLMEVVGKDMFYKPVYPVLTEKDFDNFAFNKVNKAVIELIFDNIKGENWLSPKKFRKEFAVTRYTLPSGRVVIYREILQPKLYGSIKKYLRKSNKKINKKK